jgi:hypothetical protein
MFCTTPKLENSDSNCRISKLTCLVRTSNFFSSSFYEIHEVITFEIGFHNFLS